MPQESPQIQTVLECWAPWCEASRRMALHMAEVAAELVPPVVFARLNADEEPESLEEHQVRVLPTLLFLDARGQEVTRIEGECGREEVEAILAGTTHRGGGM